MSRVLLALAEARDEPQPWVLALIELAEEVATDTNPANVHAHAVFAKQALADVPEALRRVAEEKPDCPGCTDYKSEGTHSLGTRQHP